MPTVDASLLNDIREVNLSYLLLAQRLLRENLAAGMFRLGFDADVAETIIKLSPAQVIRLASSSSVLCGFRLNDGELLANLTHDRSEEHTSELQSLMRISYAVFCLKKKTTKQTKNIRHLFLT